ncbi:MAG TPA: class I SAM-dependent methyltransferase [Blastocatellia bacterium]|jgi:SAM-dependent methyltransferase
MPNLISFYEKKDTSYFGYPCEELIRLISGSGIRVLDVGCGAGATGNKLLQDGKAKWVTGIELVPEQGQIARSVLNEVCIGDIEEMPLRWSAGYFDCFVFGDFLEHARDPWGLLRRLRPLLADDGIVVASIPNVKHWPVIVNLILHDDWKYDESGVLDITHLRFFTRRSSIRLFSEAGYSVETVRPYFNGRRYSIPSKVTFGALAGFLAQRWLILLNAA